MYNAAMMKVTLTEARDRLAELLAEAAGGGEVMITGEDGSAFKLIPSEAAPKKKRGLIGSARGQIWMANDFDEIPEGFEEYMS
jgi:antitoxin (DNA-binding transcriptional repressor) of toxin-antitoxin stability system